MIKYLDLVLLKISYLDDAHILYKNNLGLNLEKIKNR